MGQISRRWLGSFLLLFQCSAVRRTLVAIALACASAGAWALPSFTFIPPAAGLTCTSVTADNITLSEFANVTFTGATTFAETGFLSITGYELGGSGVVQGGLNSTCSLYFQFISTGHLTSGTASTDPRIVATAGVFDTLTYSLVGAFGHATFGFVGTTPAVTPGGATRVLATGSLVNGTFTTTPAISEFDLSTPFSGSFAVAPGTNGFFSSPFPFYDQAFAGLHTTVTTNQMFGSGGVGSGFLINNGAGSLAFGQTVPVPEPATLALLSLGLAGLGFARRKQ